MRALGSRPGCSCAPRCCAPAPSAASSAAAWGRRWSWSRRRRRRSSGSRLPSGRALRLAKGGEAGWNSVRGARGHALCSHGQGEMHGLQRPASPSKRRTMGPSCEARRFAGHTDAPPSSPPPPSRTKWTRLVHHSVLTGHVSSLWPGSARWAAARGEPRASRGALTPSDDGEVVGEDHAVLPARVAGEGCVGPQHRPCSGASVRRGGVGGRRKWEDFRRPVKVRVVSS